MSPGPERNVHANGVDLCLQTFGEPGDPPVLLIAGAAASMSHWPDPLCERIARGQRLVIRYDHRDTGRSATYPRGEPPYTGSDLADDAVAILDLLAVGPAHLVGMSMGGGLAQSIAIDHPARVASLTLISTSPAAAADRDRDLPGMNPGVAASFAGLAEPDWADRAATIDYLFESERLCAASETDQAFIGELAERTVDRAERIGSIVNHFELDDDAGHPPGALGSISAPTLVIHGDRDPILPLPHGRALAAEIPGARFLVLERVGHELPPSLWDKLADAILVHTG